jgi:hypothetical protein
MAHSQDIELGNECPTPLSRLTELAKEDPARRFYSIAHFLTPRALYEAFKGLRKDASAGVDGVTFQDYQKELGRNLQNLHERVKRGQYQAQPLRRVYIPKEECDANESQTDLAFSAVTEDEGRPLGVDVQKSASNQAVLLRSKRSWVVNDCRKS